MTFLAFSLNNLSQSLGGFLIPALMIMFFFAFIFMIKALASRYQKIPPNKVAIIYGKGAKATAGQGQISGCKVVSGGGVLVWPVIQEIAFMDTAVFKMTIQETGIPNKDNVPISIKGVAVCKISTKPEDLQSAAASFLNKTQLEIEDTISSTLIGHVRSIIAKLDIGGILRERDEFNKMVVKESTEEIKRMGIEIVTLVIQEVTDDEGYIESLGKKTVAQAKRDADILVAEAEAETAKKVSDAQRTAAIVQAQNAVEVAKAEKDRDISKAQFKKMADTELAAANVALAIATAAQQQTLKVAEAERDAASASAQVKVQEKEAERKQKELIATVIRPAEAQKQAAVITAEGEKAAAILNAEATKQVAIENATGQAQAAEMLGKGQAAQTLATMNAKAEGEANITKQALLAKAEGDRANLLAQAEGIAAQKGLVLKAEAEGTEALAKALAQMTDAAKLILILDRLPTLLDRGGDAAAKVMQGVFGPVAAGLANIDKITITDIGGTGRGVTQMGNIVPEVVFNFLAGMKARGIDVAPLLAKAGLNVDELVKTIGLNTAGEKPAVKPDEVTNA
jgi:flotillin